MLRRPAITNHEILTNHATRAVFIFCFFFSPLCWLFRVGLDLSSKTRYDGYKLFTVTGAGAADGALDVLR